jgi:PAS domain S-box-containing protein
MTLSAHRFDQNVALLYLFFGGLWVLLSDRLLAVLVSDGAALTAWQTYKGWAFVLLSAALIYGLLRRELRRHRRDEQALRESEERYRLIFEHSMDAILLSAPDGSIFDANPAACRMFGRGAEEIRRLGRAGVLDVSDPRVPTALAELISSGRFHGELDFVRANGATFPGEISSTLFTNSDGRQRSSVIIRDISARRQAEQEIRRLNTALEARVVERTAQLTLANRELEAFSYSVSHDLRAPLRAINGFATIIARRYRADLNDEGRHYLDNIIQATQHMGLLIDDLLAYARLGRAGVRRLHVPLAPLLADLAEQARAQLASLGGTINLEANQPVVLGDPTLLRQIFSNLLENALTYYQPEHPPRITISHQQIDNFATVRISDNGIGIADEYHAKIFNIFQRLHSDHQYSGTGIGLANVKKAVDLLGGTVAVESQIGLGSTFIVSLPLPPDSRNLKSNP